MAGDVVTWGAVALAIGSLLSIIGFWTKYSDRITKADARAAQADARAAQAEKVAEEAKKNAAEAESKIHAVGAKLYQVEIWARDEFVRKTSFEGVVSRMEKGFSELKQEISTRLDRMTDRIEHLGGHGER